MTMETPKNKLALAFTFDYQDFLNYLERPEKNDQKTQERMFCFKISIDFFKECYHCSDEEAFKYLKKKLERAKHQQFKHHTKREQITQILADQTKSHPDADDSEQNIFPPIWDELISNYLWYCKRAKHAYENWSLPNTKNSLLKVLDDEAADQRDQEIREEIRRLEERFNEENGEDPNLWTRIAELKGLL